MSLQNINTDSMSKEELQALILKLTEEKKGKLEFKVGEKGGVSVYGMGRWPITLYYDQWLKLLDSQEELRNFLEEQKAMGKLSLERTPKAQATTTKQAAGSPPINRLQAMRIAYPGKTDEQLSQILSLTESL